MSEYAALTNEQLIDRRRLIQANKASVYDALDEAEAEARAQKLGAYSEKVVAIREQASDILNELRRLDVEMTNRNMDYPLYFGSRTRQKREPNDC